MMFNREKEWVDFAEQVRKHVVEYTIKQYGDGPNDNVAEWTTEDCIKQIGRYLKRIGVQNSRGHDDNVLCFLKIAHYACLAHSKIQDGE